MSLRYRVDRQLGFCRLHKKGPQPANAYAADADSRDYVIAYEIHSSDDLPPDFCSSYPPRLLALTGNGLTIVPHPSANEQVQLLALERLCFIESGHVLL